MSDAKQMVPFDLDMSLDDIDDLPSFNPWAKGGYVLTYDYAVKTVAGHENTIEIKLTCLSVEEVGEEDTIDYATPKPGDTTNILFMTDNEVGRGMLKNFLQPIREKFGTSGKTRETLDAGKGAQMLALVDRREDKNSGKHYNSIKKMGFI
jgi:hypothetical protein